MKSRGQLIDNILWLQDKMNNLILNYKADNWMQLELSIDQLKSLVLIWTRGKISFHELANALGITRSNITGIADRLVQNGLVTRHPNLTGDRRLQYLMLTEKGSGVLSKIKQQTTEDMIQILASLNTEDLAALDKGMAAVIRAAESYFSSRRESPETGAGNAAPAQL